MFKIIDILVQDTICKWNKGRQSHLDKEIKELSLFTDMQEKYKAWTH